MISRDNPKETSLSSFINKLRKKEVYIPAIATVLILGTLALYSTYKKGEEDTPQENQPNQQEEVAESQNNNPNDSSDLKDETEQPSDDLDIKHKTFQDIIDEAVEKNPGTNLKTVTIKDPGTGDDVIIVLNKTPEINGRENSIIMYGESKFINESGIEMKSVTKLRELYKDFASTQDYEIKSFSMAPVEKTPIDDLGNATAHYKTYINLNKDNVLDTEVTMGMNHSTSLKLTEEDGDIIYNSSK